MTTLTGLAWALVASIGLFMVVKGCDKFLQDTGRATSLGWCLAVFCFITAPTYALWMGLLVHIYEVMKL